VNAFRFQTTTDNPDRSSSSLEGSDAKRRLEDKRTSHTNDAQTRCRNFQRAFNEIGQVVHIACDQWQCEFCQRVLAWRWAERIRYAIALWGGPTYFWTLTLPGWVDDPAKGYKLIPRRWPTLAQAVRRKTGEFDYAAFVEAHPHRMDIPHFHVISLQKAPTRLKDMAVHAGFGHQAKEVLITGKHAASYVTKYASKQGRSMPKGFRRVRTSQHFPKLPEPCCDLAVYPMAKGESVRHYLARIAGKLAVIWPQQLTERWLDPSRDII
jgi:hypothetical protein